MDNPNDRSIPSTPSKTNLSQTGPWHSGQSESSQSDGDTVGQHLPGAAQDAGEHPARIGRYRIDRILGKGAFGTVYQGYDDELKRPVAIKAPHRHRVGRPED